MGGMDPAATSTRGIGFSPMHPRTLRVLPRPDEPVTLPALQSILHAPQRVGGRVETTLRTVDKMFYVAGEVLV